MSNVENMLGLMPKAKTSARVSGDPLLNFKLNVGPERRERWIKANKRLSARFSGGGNAIMLHKFDSILLDVERAAESVPESAPVGTKGDKKQKGGAV